MENQAPIDNNETDTVAPIHPNQEGGLLTEESFQVPEPVENISFSNQVIKTDDSEDDNFAEPTTKPDQTVEFDPHKEHEGPRDLYSSVPSTIELIANSAYSIQPVQSIPEEKYSSAEAGVIFSPNVLKSLLINAEEGGLEIIEKAKLGRLSNSKQNELIIWKQKLRHLELIKSNMLWLLQRCSSTKWG